MFVPGLIPALMLTPALMSVSALLLSAAQSALMVVSALVSELMLSAAQPGLWLCLRLYLSSCL